MVVTLNRGKFGSNSVMSVSNRNNSNSNNLSPGIKINKVNQYKLLHNVICVHPIEITDQEKLGIFMRTRQLD